VSYGPWFRDSSLPCWSRSLQRHCITFCGSLFPGEVLSDFCEPAGGDGCILVSPSNVRNHGLMVVSFWCSILLTWPVPWDRSWLYVSALAQFPILSVRLATLFETPRHCPWTGCVGANLLVFSNFDLAVRTNRRSCVCSNTRKARGVGMLR